MVTVTYTVVLLLHSSITLTIRDPAFDEKNGKKMEVVLCYTSLGRRIRMKELTEKRDIGWLRFLLSLLSYF